MKRRIVCGFLLLLAGCAPDEPPVSAVSADEGWRVHVAEPEAGEDHPGSVLLTRRAEGEAGQDVFRPRLVLGCDEGVTVAYVEWGTPLGAGALPVTYRLDDGPAQAARWTISDDGEAAGLWADSLSVPFLRALPGRERLAVAGTPQDGDALQSRFALDGLDSLVAEVRSLCPWE